MKNRKVDESLTPTGRAASRSRANPADRLFIGTPEAIGSIRQFDFPDDTAARRDHPQKETGRSI